MKCEQSRYFVDNFSEKYLTLYFMDIVHITWTLSILHGHCPYYMDIVHITWTLSILHGHCPYYMDIVHITWTLSILHGHCPYYMDIVHITWTLSILHGHYPYYMDIVHVAWTIVRGQSKSMDNCLRNVQDPISFLNMTRNVLTRTNAVNS
jgi:hypothetical protein